MSFEWLWIAIAIVLFIFGCIYLSMCKAGSIEPPKPVSREYTEQEEEPLGI